jgi:anti-anti-sigma factor
VREEQFWTRIAVGPPGYHVVVGGEVDVAGAAALTNLLRSLVDAGARLLGCEMEAVGFFGAAGARALARIAGDLEDRGGRLTVERPSHAVRRVLELTGLTQLLVAPLGVGVSRGTAEEE